MYETDQIKIAMIATYPELSKIFEKVVEEKKDILFINKFASFEEAIEIAKIIATDVDIILSRGGTAEYIRRNVDIPVVFIPITPFDVVMAMQKLDKNIREVALSYFSTEIFGINEIQKMYDVKIHEYAFVDRNDIEQNIIDAKNRGIKVIIGGEVAVRFGRKHGLNGIELSAGDDTVNRAVDEAISIVKAARAERDKATLLRAALNSLTEGLIVTDEDNKIIIENPIATKFLGESYQIGDIYTNSDFYTDNIDSKSTRITPKINQMIKIKDILVNINILPIYVEDRFIGLVHTFEDVTKIQQLEQDLRNQLHTKGFIAKYTFDDIITSNQKLNNIIKNAKLYAKTDSSVLIEGESGTGKELFAQSLHNASERGSGPFIAVNCAAIPENLLESELFGYEAGAFTGARKEGKRGWFELAHRGTIFLDEISEIPKPLQSRLR
jgi:transcriptional regulator with PAS, ATPase and Fis domain